MENLTQLSYGVNILWTLIGAALVFFMQAGFAMVETGFTRAKNAGNIIMKNLMDFSIGTVVFWFIGFGIMQSAGNGFIGGMDLFINKGLSESGYTDFTTVIFQTVFCATSATIVSGAMAERTKFSSYCVYSLIISLIIYPISGHWIWNANGWLAKMGFHDFAGSTAVHMVGGAAALVGAKILGPRIGKYDKNGNPRAIPGHSLTLGALGCFILWFAWFGFNGASTVAMFNVEDGILSAFPAVVASRVFVTTNLAAASATVVTMLFTWIKYKKPDVSMTLNGSLAGLVAITAGCDMVTPAGAAIIGAIAGLLIVVGVEFVDKVLKIDDPVGAIGVHFVNGAAGTILTGLFAYYSEGGVEITKKGLFYGGGFNFFGVQCLGVISVIAWVVVTMTVVFLVIKKTIGLRVSAHEEIVGLDIEEHGISSSYADFMPSIVAASDSTDKNVKIEPAVNVDKAVPVKVVSSESSNKDDAVKITKISILCNQTKFEELKNALNNIGVTGITVSNVLGCGVQKGATKFYRGAPIDMTLRPKVQVDVVVAKVPVAQVIETAKNTLYTGKIGDGKIFVYDVENVVKVRTGEEGFDALQGVDE